MNRDTNVTNTTPLSPRYYKMKMTLEDLETHEHITYVNAVTGELMTTTGKFRRESCEADELTSISQVAWWLTCSLHHFFTRSSDYL